MIIFAIIWFIGMSTLSVFAYKTEIWLFYHNLRNKPISYYFSDFHEWEEGDRICFINDVDSDNYGKLIALSNDEVLIGTKYNDKPLIIKPYLIKFNETHEERQKAESFRTFHEDILPVLTDKEAFQTVHSTKRLTN